MKRYQRTAISQYILVASVLLSLVALGFLSDFVMKQIPFEDQFAVPWAAGRLWLLEDINPYSPEVSEFSRNQLAESNLLAGLPDTDRFLAPLFNLIFYLPFSLIPYSLSKVIWTTLLILVIGLIGYFSIKLSGWKLTSVQFIFGLAIMLLWFPSILAILSGGLSPVIIFLILFGFFLMMKGEDTTAGFIFALTFGALPVSILFLIFITIFSIVKRRWSILTAYLSGVAFLVVVSSLMLPSWFMDWLGLTISRLANLGWVQTPIMTLATQFPGIYDFLAYVLHAVILGYFIVLLITLADKSDLVVLWRLQVVLVLSYFLQITASIPHLLFLLPALFMIFRFWSERWLGWGRIISWIALIGIGAGSWLMLFPEGGFSKMDKTPLAAIGLGAAVLIGILWSRWWISTVPQLFVNVD